MTPLHITWIQEKPFLWCTNTSFAWENNHTLLPSIYPVLRNLLDLPVKEHFEEIYIWLPSTNPKKDGKTPLLKSHKVIALHLEFLSFKKLIALSQSQVLKNNQLSVSNSYKWTSMATHFFRSILKQEVFLPFFLQDFLLTFDELRLFMDPEEQQTLLRVGKTIPAICRCGTKKSTAKPTTTRKKILVNTLNYCFNDILQKVSRETYKTKSSETSIFTEWLQYLTGDKENKNHNQLYTSPTKKDSQVITPLIQHPRYLFGFRIQEPTETSDSWVLEIILQETNQTHSIHALQTLHANKSFQETYPINYIQGSLQHAFSISTLLQMHPTIQHKYCIQLTSKEALHFLEKDVPMLMASGFLVITPDWWESNQNAKTISIKGDTLSEKKSITGKNLSLFDIVDFQVNACIDGDTLSPEEIDTLAAAQEPFVKLQNKWVHINPSQIKMSLQKLDGFNHTITGKEVLDISIGKQNEWNGIPIHSIHNTGWIQKVVTTLQQHKRVRYLHQPRDFVGTLRQYQIHGFSWIAFLRKWGLGACLADDMGLGKTIQALAFLQREFNKECHKPILLVCPTSVINNWKKEIQRFTPTLPFYVHHGPKRMKYREFQERIGVNTIVITSYQLLHRDISFIHPIHWGYIIADEAQNMKNPDSLQSKAARTLQADFKLALTGTPIENHIGDLWAIMDFLNPGLLGKLHSFEKDFLKPIHIQGDTEKTQQLKSIVNPFILRREKTDSSIIADLPDKIENKEYCLLTKEQVSLYRAYTKHLESQLQTSTGISRKGLILSAFIKLKQICNHPAHFKKETYNFGNRSGKLMRTCELIDDIQLMKEHVLVFTQFVQMGIILQKYFESHFSQPVFFLHGGVPKDKRDTMIHDFQTDTHAPSIFILSLKAGGTGVNLTRANHIIHFDRWWNPAVENQATDRAFRIGQHKNVHVHKLITAGTLEEHIDELLEHKTKVSGQIIETSSQQWITELSNEEINDLVQLNDDITVE